MARNRVYPKQGARDLQESHDEGAGVASRIRSSVGGAVEGAMERSDDYVRDHLGSTALVTFGIGAAFGLMAAWLITAPRKRSWYSSYVPAGYEQYGRNVARSIRRGRERLSECFE